MRDED